MNNCKTCGMETKNPSYCSRSCSTVNSNTVSPRRKLGKHKCKTCDTPVRAGYTYCTSCFNPDAKDMSLNDAMYRHLHKASAFALIRTRARAATSHMKRECQNCGYSKHVEVCHIRAVKDFPLSAMVSEVNDLKNLVLLCPNCHWEMDHQGLVLGGLDGN